jgi:hypothetical protein
VPDDLATGGARLEHLPDEAFECDAQAEDSMATIWSFVLAGEERSGQEAAEMCPKLFERALPQTFGRAGAHGSKP